MKPCIFCYTQSCKKNNNKNDKEKKSDWLSHRRCFKMPCLSADCRGNQTCAQKTPQSMNIPTAINYELNYDFEPENCENIKNNNNYV